MDSDEYIIGRLDTSDKPVSISKPRSPIVWEYHMKSNAEPSQSNDLEVEESRSLLEKRLRGETKSHKECLHILMDDNETKTRVAMEGSAFQYLLAEREKGKRIDDVDTAEMVRQVLKKGRIFSRMSPKQKALLVEEFQKETGEMVGMCGDGAND